MELGSRKRGFGTGHEAESDDAPAHLWLAHYLSARARFNLALQEVCLARDLDPLSPIIQTQVGWILKFARRSPDAIVEFRKALEMEPGYEWAWQLGGALINTGDYAGSIQVLQKAVDRNRSPSAVSALGQAYGMAGQRRGAEEVLAELLAISRQHYVPPPCFAHVYGGLRDRVKVFEWIEKAYQERSNHLLWLRAIDRETARRILHALTRYGEAGEGDVKALSGE